MTTELSHVFASVGVLVGMITVALLCAGGVVLSCLSISGTWLVVAGTVLAAIMRRSGFPGWWTVLVFVVIAVMVEIVEAVAGAFGVRRRGGSRFAGLVAVAGGILGLWLGAFIPVPVFGSLVGMVVMSFILVFGVEAHRLRKVAKAAGIAWGTVVAHVFVVLLKVTVTVGMAVYLLVGLLIR